MRDIGGSRAWLVLVLAAISFAGQSHVAHAQLVREHDIASVRAFHGGGAHIRRSFQSDKEAQGVLREILVAAGLAGLEDRIILRASADTANAEALIEKSERLILYNAVFMQELRKQTNDYWSLVAVLAHELGHHVRFHTVIAGREHEFELEADYQAGFILRRMGATLEQAQGLFRTFPVEPSKSHPGRDQRLQAVTLGWSDGAGERTTAARTAPSLPPISGNSAAAGLKPAQDCEVLSGRLDRPLIVRQGSRLCNKERTAIAVVHDVTTYSVTYSVGEQRRVTCRKGETCSFSWDGAPVFKIGAIALDGTQHLAAELLTH